MANAAVDKLKAFGIKHGEKVVVGITAAACLALTALAVIRPSLDMKPEELATSANNASANLSKVQPEADVLAKLEKDGLVDPNFVKIVDNQLKNAIKPDGYRAKLDWVTPEPGAGLIRDQPELIAPTELIAFPGRGGILLFAVNDKGERILDTGDEAKKNASRKGGPRRETAAEKKKKEDAEEKRLAAFGGKEEVDKAKDKEKKDDAPAAAAPEGPYKEETKGKRWVVITGVIDNEQLKKNYLLALKNPAIAYPNYKRVDVERRSRQYDGTWTEWSLTDEAKKYEVLDNMTESETEYVPASQRPEALVDPLPFLRAGYWTGVHVAKLVPADVLETPKTQQPAAGGSGGKMGRGGMTSEGSSMAMGGESRMPGGAAGGRGMGSPMAGGGSSVREGGGGGIGAGGMGASGGVGDAEDGNFAKIDEKVVMLRSLDFSVEPDTTYQFRARIVVVNPNFSRVDVNPGVDVEKKELAGPWSEPTDNVTVLPDVSAYAQAPEPASRRDDLVTFQVVKWDSSTGHTVLKNDIAGPGEIIGEFGPIQMPSSLGKGATSAPIDFNSRSIVLDTLGGNQKLPDIGVERNSFSVPAVAMILEPDGTVVVRSQARDKADDVREDMDSGYKQALADSGKARTAGSGSKKSTRDPRSGGKKKKKRR